VQYENFSNERWDVTSPNITYSKFDNANNWPYAPAAFTPRKYTWYTFLLEAESTLGP